jgi:DNA-binding MarR family transcriptional regulator
MDIDQEIAKLINELGRISQQQRPCQEFNNLTVLNIQVLTYIFFSDKPPKMRDIAEAIGLSLPSVSTIVDRLEEIDLVIRVHDEQDRRAVQAHLTSKGHDIIQSEIEKATSSIKKGLSGLNNKDKQTVLNFFQAYAGAIKKQFEGK